MPVDTTAWMGRWAPLDASPPDSSAPDANPSDPGTTAGRAAPAPIWLVTGAKGGCGATLLTTSLAWALAERGRQVVVLDFDLLEGQAAMHLCERNAGPTVNDALSTLERLDATLLDTLMLRCAPRLRLLASPGGNPPQAAWDTKDAGAPSAQQLSPALARLAQLAAEQADHVLVDLPMRTVLSGAAEDLLGQATRRIVVTEPSLSAVYNARRSLEDLDRRGTPADEVVINRSHRTDIMSAKELQRALKPPSTGLNLRILPRADEVAAQAVHQGLAVGQVQPRDALARALQAWAQEVGTA